MFIHTSHGLKRSCDHAGGRNVNPSFWVGKGQCFGNLMVVCIGSARCNRNFNITAHLGRTRTFDYFLSLRSQRFRGKFRCFSRAKVGARAKKKEWERREEPYLLSPCPLFFLCSRRSFRAAKTSKFATETLATHISSQPITSRTYQRLLYLLTNQIAHQGF